MAWLNIIERYLRNQRARRIAREVNRGLVYQLVNGNVVQCPFDSFDRRGKEKEKKKKKKEEYVSLRTAVAFESAYNAKNSTLWQSAVTSDVRIPKFKWLCWKDRQLLTQRHEWHDPGRSLFSSARGFTVERVWMARRKSS